MGDTRKHSKPIILRKTKPLRHPGEVMRQRKMTTLNTLRLTLRATGEAQSSTRVRTNKHTGVLPTARYLRFENIAAVDQASLEATIVLKRKVGDKRPDLEVLGHEICDCLHRLAELFVGPLDAHEELGVCDFQQDGLSLWGVLGINYADDGAGLESSQVSNNEVNTMALSLVEKIEIWTTGENKPSVSVNGNHISYLTAVSQEVVSQLIRTLMDLAVSESSLWVTSTLGLDNTLSVGELVRVLSENVMNSYPALVRRPLSVLCLQLMSYLLESYSIRGQSWDRVENWWEP